ncbi:hypothetical protein [Endozoicomonas elysicola]|uniref:Uncharacterized protein n=1 Tax=Endozoicomonas elysicola TaxID=305900 RepID=A0A081K9C3_9GAMM|nr:hypothetical protein [Endozoicomonas elysicola]KEI70749.1 hypothetical protein GV64_08335 [Endozoicomonas elysicola]
MTKSQAGSKNKDRLQLLEQQLENMAQMEALLLWSYERCRVLPMIEGQMPEQEALEKFESLTARFARFNDILLQKIFRLIDSIDLDDVGTVRDRINRAEKKGLIDDAQQFIEIRELRNSIAHEYQPEALSIIFPETLQATPVLLDIAERVREYARRYGI